MTRARVRILIGVLVAVLCCGCKDWFGGPQEEVVVPVSICLPMSEVYSAQHNAPSALQRSFGDPGTTEHFRLPNHLYFIVMMETSTDNWELWHAEERTINNGDWKLGTYGGLLEHPGDSIFEYTEEIRLLLSSEGRKNGRVYAIASAVPLTFDRTLNSTGITSLNGCLDLAFTMGSTAAEKDTMRHNLQHIYSTPYNYNVGGKYYGYFYKEEKVPHLNLLLYHVATKVDVIWNVDPAKQSAVKLSFLEAYNLYEGSCLAFRPLENSATTATYDQAEGERGYTHTILNGTASPGTQWAGRDYFYTVPYKNKFKEFPMQFRMRQNNDPVPTPPATPASGEFRVVIMSDVADNAVFTSWERAQLNIKTDLNLEAPKKKYGTTDTIASRKS